MSEPTHGWECVLETEAHAEVKADPATPAGVRAALDYCSPVDEHGPGGVIFTVDPELEAWLAGHPGFEHFTGGTALT
jgi:hypothetical protein